MSLEEIKEVALKEINGLPKNFRCHEAARKIGNQLRLLRVNVAIKDGVVVYNPSPLLKDFFSSMDFFDGLPEEAKRELLERDTKKKIRVFHSWCEVTDNQNDIIVVDWHAFLKVSRDESWERILIVEKKNNLPHNYFPVGITIGKWIIFKMLPPYAIRLRL
jgi:hypothetical protein